MIIADGRIIPFLLLILTYLAVYLMIRRSIGGKVPIIRILPAVEALDEGIGRCTEMGRPLHYTTGWGGNLTSKGGPYHLAGINLLGTIAQKTSEKGSGLMVSVGHTDTLPLVQETVRDAYFRSDRLEEFNLSMIRFTAPYQMAYATSVLRMLEDERPAASYLLGDFSAEMLILAEGGSRIGAFQIGGCQSASALPFMIATCNYVLIGEELLVAGSMAINDVISIGGIIGEDIPKLLSIAMIIIGIIFATIGYDWSWFLNL